MAAKSSTLVVELPAALAERVAEIAASREQTSAELVEASLIAMIEDEDAFQAAIEEACIEADKGVFVSSEKFEAWVLSRGTENELPMPEPDIFPDSPE